MTPLQMSMLIWAYVSPVDYFDENPDNETQREQYGALVEAGLIRKFEDRKPTCTVKGRAHLEYLLQVEFPEQVWAHPTQAAKRGETA